MTGQKPHVEQPAPARTEGNSRVLDAIQSLGLLGVILIGGLLLSFASPVFFSRINIENLLFASTIVAVVAMGQAFVILVAGIDLAVGAVLALASVLGVVLATKAGLPVGLAALLALAAGTGIGLINGLAVTVLALASVLGVVLATKAGLPVGLAALLALAAGTGIGLINGLAVTVLRLPALIATLAMMSITRGVAYLISDGRNIAPVPAVYVDIQGSRLFGVPVVIILTVLLGVLAHFVLTRTRFGREIYATGGNAVAARLAGIRTNRVIVIAYMISGFAAALGGLMITARLEAGAATAGFGYELTVISAVVIGGVSLFGGEGRIIGVLLGVILLGLVQNAVNLLNVPPNYDYVVSGAVIAAAATLDVYRRRLVESGLRRRTMTIRREKAQSRDAAQTRDAAQSAPPTRKGQT